MCTWLSHASSLRLDGSKIPIRIGIGSVPDPQVTMRVEWNNFLEIETFSG